MVTTYETLGGAVGSLFSQFEEPDLRQMEIRGFVDSGFVTPEGEPIFVPVEDKPTRWHPNASIMGHYGGRIP